jgi:aldose 1-epimerase
MIAKFGEHPNGKTVHQIIIGDEHLRVSLLTYGASIQSIKFEEFPFSLCLGFPTLDAYLNAKSYFGAVIGRVANRIAEGRATIDGSPYIFDQNEAGQHTLHGGREGVGTRMWTLAEASDRRATLTLSDADGMNGFPGTLDIAAHFEVLPHACLEVSLEASTAAPTLCNLAPHPYFNLDGYGDARLQTLQVNADAILVTDDEMIPTGDVASVSGTPWDHREAKRMNETGLRYDTNFCLSPAQVPLRDVARLSGEDSGITMRIATTEPGLQVYDGAGLSSPFSGIALEPQAWPDAPNHPNFPSILLRPGAVSRQTSRFSFGRC